MPPTAPPKSCTATITRLDQALLFKILDALEGTKTIVWDRFLMTEFNSTVSYQLLKEHNVVSHVCPVINPIVKKTDHILYIIPPYLHSTKELIESHLKKIPEIVRFCKFRALKIVAFLGSSKASNLLCSRSFICTSRRTYFCNSMD
jgi:hypothetical protein